MSGNGQVIAGTRSDGPNVAMCWSEKTGVQNIVIPSAKNSAVGGILDNDGLLVGGTFSDGDGRAYGFLWSEKDGLQRFGEKDWTEKTGTRDAGANDASDSTEYEITDQTIFKVKIHNPLASSSGNNTDSG